MKDKIDFAAFKYTVHYRDGSKKEADCEDLTALQLLHDDPAVVCVEMRPVSTKTEHAQ